MAEVTVLVWRIDTSYDSPLPANWNTNLGPVTITAGNHIHVIVDDVTFQVFADYRSSSTPGGGSFMGRLTEGPNLFFGYNGAATLLTVQPYWQTCDGTTLRKVGSSNVFPYGTLSNNPNAAECQIAPVCDLEISPFYEVQDATGPTNADGSITITATSSNGTIKYSFNPNFEYGTAYELYPLPPLNLWGAYNTSSEPGVWTGGTTPTLAITAPTLLVPAVFDWFGPVITFTTGQSYRYSFTITGYSANPVYIWVRVVAGDVSFNIVSEKIVAGYTSVGGTVYSGIFEFTATAAMTRLAVVIQIPGGTAVEDIDVEINSFSDLSGTPQGPDVQLTGEFNNLLPGVYTIYAKDAIGCQDQITIEVGVINEYAVKYRLEFQDTLHESGKFHRVDILERNYVGEIIEFCSGGDPLHVKWNGDSNDPNKTLIPSELDLQVLKEAVGEFEDLFTDDDRKFKVEHRVSDINDFTGIPLYWTGYVVPELHNEPWVFEPFPLDITATDQLGELKNLDFLDRNGNKIKGDQKAIKLIAEILKTTGLELNIRCGLNIFAAEMTTAITDDPLDQAYIDTRIFLDDKDSPLKCEEVIDRILTPFRAQLCQAQGYWWLRRLSDAVGTFAYREFDPEGEYVDNNSLAPTLGLKFPSETNRAAWANRSAFLSHFRNYGYFSITQNLGKDNNLIDEGRFEEDDITELSSGNQFFKNWNFIQGQSGVIFGFENVINGNSKGAFFADFENANNAQNYSKLYSVEVPLGQLGTLRKFQFQYFVEPRFSGLSYITLGWSVKVTNGPATTWMRADFPPDFSRANNTQEIINEIYVTSFNTWNTFELTAANLAVSAPSTLQITFYMHNHYGRDFANEAALRAFSITDLDDSLQSGLKRMMADTVNGLTYVFVSEADAVSADDFPNVVRPDDYANDYLWKLEKILNLAPNQGLVKKFLIDNVSIGDYPTSVINNKTVYIDPPETISYSEELSTFIKSNFGKTVYLGDMIRFDDEYEGDERLIYRGYFRTADGTPTTEWTRTLVTESKKLLQITLEDFRDQFRTPRRKLSGTFISDIVWTYINSVAENFEGSRYQFLTFDFDAKRAMYTIDMIATGTGAGGEPPVENGAFSNAYSDAFDNV